MSHALHNSSGTRNVTMFVRKMLFSILLITAPLPAFAYIDPGIIGSLFQGLYIAIFGFVTAWLFKPWQYLKSWLQSSKRAGKKQAEKADNDNTPQQTSSNDKLK